MRLPKAIAVGLIRGYQLLVSPFLAPCCRFHPTCSDYALNAVSRHGIAKGGLLALIRVGRCHPWGGAGYDPVPDHPALFCRLAEFARAEGRAEPHGHADPFHH